MKSKSTVHPPKRHALARVDHSVRPPVVANDQKRALDGRAKRRATFRPPKQLMLILLLLGVLLSSVFLTGCGQNEPFQFVVPEGFRDLSSGASSSSAEGVPAELRERAKKFRGYAVVVEDGDVTAEYSVEVREVPREVDRAVDQIAEAATSEPNRQLIDRATVPIHGVDCGRLEFTGTFEAGKLHKLVYVLPLGSGEAQIALEAFDTHFDELRPRFEAAVHRTKGIEPPRDDGKQAAKLGAVLAIGAFGGLLIRSLRAKRRARQARPRKKKPRAPAER